MLQVDYQDFLSTSLIIIVSNNKLQQSTNITLNQACFQGPIVNYSACRRRGGVLKCPRFCFFSFFSFSVSKVGPPLMGYTAVQYTDCYLSPCQHDFYTQFLAEYVAKIHNLTCILQHLNSKKVVRSKILILNVL